MADIRFCSATVPAIVRGVLPAPARQDALATAGKMPALRENNLLFGCYSHYQFALAWAV